VCMMNLALRPANQDFTASQTQPLQVLVQS
jgi:hypothetical protein